MRPFLILGLAVLFPGIAVAAIQVNLSFTPTQTLPAYPVAMRVAITNGTTAAIEVMNRVDVTMKSGSGSSSELEFDLPPHVWAGESNAPLSHVIQPGATLVRLAPVEGTFGLDPLFEDERSGLWRPGEYDVTLVVSTSQGSLFASAPTHLSVKLPGSEDVAVWNALSDGGTQPFTSLTLLLQSFDTIAAHPDSDYYRYVAPFAAHVMDTEDNYAAFVMNAVQTLPGAYIDGARLSVAFRYYDKASSASARNDQNLAGALSAKGRIYAQQLVDAPRSTFGAAIGSAFLPLLRTPQGWQAYFDSYHGNTPNF